MTWHRIQELESQIGGGLIEEVLQVAEGELLLVQKMKEARIWEELEEEPQEGQWTYFERKP
ncbi:NADH-ubiquinone oxidoreductase 29.9 kDa subunit, mitochondrial [Ascosphaera atra]|nr:NADH-ubiquinone oxidoreductase 29.9 kDa subunit, mitochondrial [Ascosphaera atra]